jgi:antitoxin ParD1/3/4
MNVSLTPELERFIKQEIDAGRFGTADEVIREGLRVMAERREAIADVNAMLDESEADIAAGRTYSGEEARVILRAHRQSLTASKTA